MIPKIIHYIWFGGAPFPEKIQRCVESWHRMLPDYELRLWDYEAVKDIESSWLHECLKEKRWAFASDFVRMYALYECGGIYLDTDCMVMQSFDDLLDCDMFIGMENSVHMEQSGWECYLTAHCMGAVRHHPLMKRACDCYKNRPFVLSHDASLPKSLRYNQVISPYVLSELVKELGYCAKALNRDVQHLRDGVVVYPSRFFDPDKTYPDTYCVHLALGSWRDAGYSNRTIDEVSLPRRVVWKALGAINRLLIRFGYKIMVINMN